MTPKKMEMRHAQSETTILIVEDDSMVRGWVTLALQGSSFRVVGETGLAAEVAELVARRRPGILLVDYRLPDQVGTELVRDLRLNGDSTPALLMTANAERGFNELVRDAGGQGTVLKAGKIAELVAALTAIGAGRTSFDPQHPRRPEGRGGLSPREREVLNLVASGATNRQIAVELAIGDETVKTLISRTFGKLGTRRRAEAVSAAHKLGLL